MTLQQPHEMRDLMGIDFDDRQLAAITADLRPAVIMAGAGSGKTTVMAARVVWLVGTGQVQPADILGLTFTNKAAAELAARVRSALARLPLAADAGEQTSVSTYHAFAQRLIGDFGVRLGFEPDAALLSDVRREQLAMSVVRHPECEMRALSTHTQSVVRGLLDLDDALAELAVAPADLVAHDTELLVRLRAHDQKLIGRKMIETAEKRLEFAALVEQFRRRKRSLHVIDYADMGRLALQLAETRADVVAELRELHPVVLLDEYQDTSITQRLLMQRLFGEGHSVMAVGDALQAIYEWRGASMQNILDFPRHFPIIEAGQRPLPASVFGLPVTRRFGTRLGSLANAITADLRANLPGVEPLAAQGDAQHGPGTAVAAMFDTQDAEFAWLASQLREQHDEQGIGWERMAVLVREHRNTADIHRALVAADIPVQILGKQGITSIPDIADIIAYLRVVQDPAANPSWIRILGSPRLRLGLRDVAILGRRAADLARREHHEAPTDLRAALEAAATGSDPIDIAALGDAIADPGDEAVYPLSAEGRRRIGLLHDEITRLRRRAGWPIADVVREIVQATGMHVEIAATEHAVQRGRRVMLDAFMELVATFTALDDAPTLPAFLRWLRDGETMDSEAQIEQPQRRDAVSIMTVHSAKGLQWDVVALPTLVYGVFPSQQSDPQWPTSATRVPYAVMREPVDPQLQEFARLDPADPQQVFVPTPKQEEAFREAARPRSAAEEVRLAYVAVTRAHRHLIACGSRHDGVRAAKEPSPFLLAIRDACRDGMGEVHTWSEATADIDAPVLSAATWPAAMEPEYERWLQAAAQAVHSDAALPAGLQLRTYESELIAVWDEAIGHVSARRAAAGAGQREVPAPRALSTTALQRLQADREAFVRELVRPMPKRPATAARRGSAFHLWVEQRFGQQALLDREEFAVDREDDADLAALQEGFLRTPWAEAVPVAIELPFTLLLEDTIIRGRIDAVYRDPQDRQRLVVVDWKTNRRETADPLQLSVYRHAVAEVFGVDVEATRGAFVYVATGNTVYHEQLVPRSTLGALVAGSPLAG